MADTESALLARFAGTGDAEAFAQIVRQYAGLVYGTCLRILADTDRAADATQETFFQLTKRAGEIRGSLAGWLHRVATGKAVDLIRTDSARRRREQAYLDDKSNVDQTWREVSPRVDEALTRLDGDTRDLLVRHYLEGLSMAEIARQRGVSRPTISREVESGLAKLRAQLQRQGVLVAAGALSTLLSQSTAQSAPAAVLQQLGKIAIVGAKTSSAASVPSVLSYGLAAAAKAKVIVVVAIVVVGAGLVTYMTSSPKPAPPRPGPATTDRDDRQTRSRPPAAAPVQPESAEPESPTTEVQPAQNSAVPSPGPVAAQPVTDAQPSIPWWSARDGDDGFHLDLSSPAAAVRSFTRALASGNAESVMACMLPGGTDYEDVQETMNADPDDPGQRSEYEMKLCLQAIDPDVEMPIVSTEETERGTSVVWQVTFRRDVTVGVGGNQTFRAGDTLKLDATLRKSGDTWLIDGF